MDLHPARAVASILLIVGSLIVGVTGLAIVMAKLLVEGGMAISQPDAVLLGDLLTVLPFIVLFAVAGFVAAAGLIVGTGWSDDLAIGIATVAVVVGAIGSILLSIGRDPFASIAATRATNDGIGIVGTFTALYLFIIVAVAVARLPRHISTGVTA
jgi:hypothetical protein